MENKNDYFIILFIVASFLLSLFFAVGNLMLWVAVVFGALPTLIGAVKSTMKRKISIDTFNIFAIAVCFFYGELSSAMFIVLMLTFARILNKITEAKSRNTIEELLKLKPDTALRDNNGQIEEIKSKDILVGDVLLVKDGSRIPIDGVVVFGTALINESSVTGESAPKEKIVGDLVLSSTLNEAGLIKIKATKVGKDSTIEKMVALVKEASKNKSHSERIADKFATRYFPIVLLMGLFTYLFTKNIGMTAALFLVACADDMAVAIPLAMTAALGRAASRGVIIKGGEWVDSLSKMKKLVIDKTGTLTYGNFVVKDVQISKGVEEENFWKLLGVAEKFSEHPIGRTILKEAIKKVGEVPDPEMFKVYKGSGILAVYNNEKIAVGGYDIIDEAKIKISEAEKQEIKNKIDDGETTKFIVLKNEKFLGFIAMGDVPRAQAKESIGKLKEIGVSQITMFTGDNELAANKVAKDLGIENVQASMMPQEKLEEIEKIIKQSNDVVAMVGDGVNDAAALARADVGIAMGASGSAVAVQAADVIVLNDDLSLLPETIMYSRKVMSVIKWDMIIWFISNVVGFTLVFTGIFGPALAAFYNFVSDFFPLINSARLFSKKQ